MRGRRLYRHFIITRYSVRLDGRSVLRNKGEDWLFDADRLFLRRLLFENVTLASLAASTARPDKHLVVLDVDLPQNEKLALAKVTAQYDWVELVEWQPHLDFRTIDWILESYDIQEPYLVTTQMDDDDAVHTGYLARIKAKIQVDLDSFVQPVWRWYGGAHALEWDLGLSESSALGSLKPWSGGTSYWQGVGTSLLVPAKQGEPTVYAWPHDKIEKVFCPAHQRQMKWSPIFRLRLALSYRLLKKLRVWAWAGWLLGGWLRQMSQDKSGPYDMLISNNGSNLQDIRRTLGESRRSEDNVANRLSVFGISTENINRIVQYFRRS